jgi:hypothetical protein
MLLVEKLPQPVGLIVSGNASARESRLEMRTSRRMQRRWMIAVLSRWPEPLFQI